MNLLSQRISKELLRAFKRGNKLIVIGNGGSSALSDHLVAEMLCRFTKERRPLPAISLNCPAVLTAIGNDYGYPFVFRRQIEALGNKGDVLVTMTTSGHSANVLWAEDKAKELGVKVFRLPTNQETGLSTAKTQELHLEMIHEISALVEVGV